uniref:Adenylate kinase 9 n=1 Tax=Cairina moschata TaxID=8855 RepID=A0A8C3C0F7_CAIMO
MASQGEKQALSFTDIFDEDEAEKSFLLSKPTCLIILGKPGSGKKTLARKLAQIWKCIYIEGKHTLYLEHCIGFVIPFVLEYPFFLVIQNDMLLIASKTTDEDQVIIFGLPSLSEEYMTVSQQIEKIKNLKLKPDFLINIKCSDYDLCQRISGQRQHPDSGQVYQRNQWDPKVIEKQKKNSEQHGEEEEEEIEEQEEEEVNAIAEDSLKMSEILHQLVQRPEDFLENAEERVGMYKDIMLRSLEVYVASDKNYMCHYCCFNNQDELFRALSSFKQIAPRYRWHRSRWGQACPVALKEGDIVMGDPELAVSFLGKMYVLSSPEALKKFVLNPRPYLLPPMPIPPCKVLVFGPPFSGRTTICKLIANKYKGKVEETRILGICDVLKIKSILLEMSEITADHPEVQAMVEEAVKSASESEVILSPEMYAETLERAIAELTKQNKDRYPGAPENGGWVVDNYPLSEDHWSALSEKGLLPDTVVCLQDTEKDELTFSEPFKYHGWELSAEDLDEEAEDLVAEVEAEEENEVAEEENEDEEDEEKAKEKKRHMGDTKHFCPVSLKENYVLYPGLSELAAKYQEKIYYFSNPEYREKFLKNPEEYVAHNEPIQAPPLRVCLLGTHGAGKTTCARWLADKFGIFHIQFEEYLQELLLPKIKEKIGPDFDEEPEEDDDKIKNTTRQTKHMELTDEEEAIKANLMDSEALPPEVLDNIVPDWWKKEPFRSTGFILDGFPRTSDEAQYLSERGLCPDVAVYINVEENDIIDRLFPPRLQKWRERHNKKMENKKKLKELKAKIRVGFYREHDEASEEEDESENEDIEAILEEEFLEEEEEEAEEEQEIDAVERMQNEIAERFDSERDNLQGVQEELENLLIPLIEINGGRKPHIVRYQIYCKLNSLVENRGSIFEKCYPISLPLAHKMLIFLYKFPSSFGQWDPVKLSEGEVIKPAQSPENTLFPVIHRQYIYFFSSKENKETFMKNPIKYICQPKPKPPVPVKIAIVGPPKSGKTTVARKFASVYGLMRLSIGDAIRLVINNQPESALGLQLKWHLHKGLTVPDELAIQALDVALMDHVCTIVIDGYPVTRKQVRLLESARIIPVKIFELEMDAKEVFRRALSDKESTNRPSYPVHDSSQILAIKNSCYKQHIDAIRTYYKKEHQNWCMVDATQSKWWIWNKVLQEVQVVVKEIQIYLERIKEGKAASIADLCITPEELQGRLGEFGQYCPISLAEKGELVDCSSTASLQFAAEFRGHYYKMASQEELEKFLGRPEVYVPPLAPHPLPPPDMLPKRLTAAEVKALFPKSAEMQGYCPVTYLDGKQRYEALVPGNIEYAVMYQEKVYVFETEEKLLKFMRLPEKYWNLKLPRKLPPKKEPILLTALPMAGYLEQGVATSLIKALNEVGCLKPKLPFLSVKKTALLFVAYHLKAHNPRGSAQGRRAYRQKLAELREHCELVPYLGREMPSDYTEPHRRPPGFDLKLRTFFSLKDARPAFP